MARNRKNKQKPSNTTSLRKHVKTLVPEETPTDPAGSKEVPHNNVSSLHSNNIFMSTSFSL
jgi:hypothetical protein